MIAAESGEFYAGLVLCLGCKIGVLAFSSWWVAFIVILGDDADMCNF